MKPLTRYCAVYTRKSSEEGLDQDFNSLDAQREACLAFVASQKAEGWVAVKDTYSDGGFSGGNMERPALARLLEDIRARKVHIIVVYKIDRLTRSLMDFAKLVEVFDAHGVTFVSVTQSFNTTTSMGRLTLNVLLSFAQFEREVAGERIRDKIAASKKKGIWMGGTVPLGYEVQNRSLVINQDQAARVRMIFQKYFELGCARKLKAYLEEEGVRAKGSAFFSRGALYWLLQNPVYIGQTRHKGQVYQGQHQAIIDRELWDAVQQRLGSQSVRPRGDRRALQQHLLQGILRDAEGTVYSPVFTTKKSKRYRYYVSQNKIQHRHHPAGVIARLPAHEIEVFIEEKVRAQFINTSSLARILGVDHDKYYDALRIIASRSPCLQAEPMFRRGVKGVTVRADEVTIRIDVAGFASLVEEQLQIAVPRPNNQISEITAPYKAGTSWRGAVVIRQDVSDRDVLDLPPHELRDLVRGIIWRDEHFDGVTIREIARREGHSEVFVGRLIHKSLEIA